MQNIEEYFYESNGKAIEGFLSDNKNPELLIVLKEPDSEDNPIFWFYKVVNNENGTDGKSARNKGKRFFKILGSMTCRILGKSCNNEEDLENALKKCAFINLYPYDGKPIVKKYGGYNLTFSCISSKLGTKKQRKKTKNKIENNINSWEEKKGINIESIAKNRIELFKNLYDLGIEHILTVPELFAVLTEPVAENRERFITVNYNHAGETKPREFEKCKLPNGVYVYEFWHPSYTGINYEYLDDALKK